MRDFSPECKIALLEERTPGALSLLEDCIICPRECRVNRIAGETKGICGADARLKISSANLHYGEEPPISGIRGSGTIFLSGCNLRCVYCQNYPISQFRHGEFVTVDDAIPSRTVRALTPITPFTDFNQTATLSPSGMKSLMTGFALKVLV